MYFILSSAGYCKVGWAIDPNDRLDQLQTATELTLELYHKVATNDPQWLEAKLHRFFAARRVQGEWFKLDEDDLLAVTLMQRCDRLVVNDKCFDAVEEIIPGSSTDAAKRLGSFGGKKGGVARAAKLTPERRSEIARMGGMAKSKGRSIPPPQ